MDQNAPAGSAAAGSEDRYHSLIRVAYHCIAQKGFEGLRVRDVAAQAGINIATLHYYFPSKELLIREVVLYVTHRLAETTAPGEGTPKERLRTYLALTEAKLQEEPELWAVLSEITLRMQRDPAIRTVLQQRAGEWSTFLVGVLRDGIAQGQWPVDLDPEMAAATIMTVVQGLGMRAGLLPGTLRLALAQLRQWLGLDEERQE